MQKEEMEKRSLAFAKEIIKLCRFLPETREGILLQNQLYRSAASFAAHYRSACRVDSIPEFISKLETVEEVGDQNLFWLELIKDFELIRAEILDPVIKENNELITIVLATIRSVKKKKDLGFSFSSKEKEL